MNGPLKVWDATVEAAQGRLDYTLSQLRSEELDVEGELGDYRPLRALNNAVETFRPDQIVIATRPLEDSVWQRYDVVDRARTTYSVPVTHVIAHQRSACWGGGLVTVVAGCAPRESDNAALELAAMLARSTGEDVVVAVVVAAAWPPSTERVDADYRAYLKKHGEQSLERARAWMPADVKTTVRPAAIRVDPDRVAGGRREPRGQCPGPGIGRQRRTGSRRPGQRHGPHRAQLTSDRRPGTAGIRGRPSRPGSPRHGRVRWHSEGPGRRPGGGRVLRPHGKLLADRVVLGAAANALRRDPGWRRRGPGGRRVVAADARGHRRPARRSRRGGGRPGLGQRL